MGADPGKNLHTLSLARTLVPHAPGSIDDRGWTRDGVPTPPGHQCGAITAKGDRCPKEGVVSLVYMAGLDMWPVDLCGGHFGMHRRGKPVPLAIG